MAIRYKPIVNFWDPNQCIWDPSMVKKYVSSTQRSSLDNLLHYYLVTIDVLLHYTFSKFLGMPMIANV